MHGQRQREAALPVARDARCPSHSSGRMLYWRQRWTTSIPAVIGQPSFWLQRPVTIPQTVTGSCCPGSQQQRLFVVLTLVGGRPSSWQQYWLVVVSAVVGRQSTGDGGCSGGAAIILAAALGVLHPSGGGRPLSWQQLSGGCSGGEELWLSR